MVKVCSASARISAALTLRPYVLAVASPATRPFGGLHLIVGIERGRSRRVVSFAVGLPYEVSAIVVRGDLGMSASHKGRERRFQFA